MVRNGVRACKDGACLAILALAVAKEERVRCGVAVAELAGLAYETSAQHGSAIDLRATRYYEVVAYDAVSDIYGGVNIAVDAAIREEIYSVYVAVVANAYPLDNARIGDYGICAYGTSLRGVLLAIVGGDFTKLLDKLRAVAVERHYIGRMGREFVGDNHLATSRLVQHGHFDSVSEVRLAIHDDKVAVVDDGALADRVVGDVVVDILDKAVIAHLYIV